MTTIVLVRHGQASFGTANYDRLSPLGERQAVVLGEHWQRGGFHADRALAGTLQRQQRTAEQALQRFGAVAPPLETDPAFNEFNHSQLVQAYLPRVLADHPTLAGTSPVALRDPGQFGPLFGRVVGAWAAGLPAELPVDETWEAFCARCLAGLQRATQGAERVVVFTSGGVITAVLKAALGIDNATALRLNWRIFNASVHEFQLHDKGLNLAGFNDIAHLRLTGEPALLTRL
ncbi:MAG: histidine phosphatase family protein [Ferrovibrionaceae bacterium]|uniref:histidine phosphatase family protein n=1 Tax=Nevskia sp. TaxID=1929292 RepID=UPI004035BC41